MTNTDRTLIMRYNLDSNNNTMAVKIDNEAKQISPLHYCVQLQQIADEQHRMVVVDDLGNELIEVYNMDEIKENNYYINYTSSVVYFHPSKAGKTFIFNYYGLGIELISASRIYDETTWTGEFIIRTIQEIIDKGRECIEALSTVGNAVQVLHRLEEDIATGTLLRNNLLQDIATGNQLVIDLNNTIQTGSQLKTDLGVTINTANTSKTELETTTTNANNKKVELEGAISTANISKTNLENATATADAKKTELDTSIANAQDDINTINARGNDSYIVLSTNWVGTEPNLTYTLNHGLNSKNLIVGAINDDTKFSSMPDFKYIDMNTIELQSTTRSNITVSINANYYSGKDANTIAQEVIDARIGEVNLKSKIDGIDTSINALNTEIITARGSDLTLDERLDGIDLQLTDMAKLKAVNQLRKTNTENNKRSIQGDDFLKGLEKWEYTNGIVIDETTKDLTITSSVGNHLNVALFKGVPNARGIEVKLGTLGVSGKVRIGFGVDTRNFVFHVNNLISSVDTNYTDLQRVTGGNLDTIATLPVSRVLGNDFIAQNGDRIKAVNQGQNVQLFQNGVLKCTLFPTETSKYSLPSNAPLMGAVSFRDETTGKYSIDSVKVYPKNIERLIHFSVDDFILPLKEITTNLTYTSLFEQPDFAWLKYLHDTYGAIFTLNLFYEVDGWNIGNTTTKFADEFRHNANWLKFGFHAKNATSNYSDGITSTSTALVDYNNFATAVKNFSSAFNIDVVPRVHYYAGTLDMCRAWKSVGVKGFLSSDDTREKNYYLNAIQRDTLEKCDDFYDETEGLYFVKTIERVENISNITTYLNEMKNNIIYQGRQNMRVLFTHAQYLLYQAVQKNFEDACRWALDNDYIFVFPMDYIQEC